MNVRLSKRVYRDRSHVVGDRGDEKMIYKITHEKGKLILEFEGNVIHLRSLEEIPRYLRFFDKDSPVPGSSKTRREMILSALDNGKYLSIQQILDKVGCSQDEQRNFASTALNLKEKKLLKRKKQGEIYVYALR